MVVFGKMSIIIHGMLNSEIDRGIYRTYIGNFNKLYSLQILRAYILLEYDNLLFTSDVYPTLLEITGLNYVSIFLFYNPVIITLNIYFSFFVFVYPMFRRYHEKTNKFYRYRYFGSAGVRTSPYRHQRF